MKSICFIGARGGSKGVPGKNIRLINGKPLIAHTIKKALDSNLFSHVIVSTEDQKIIDIAKKYGAEVPFVRPNKLSTDKASMEDVLSHGIKKLYSLGYNFNTFVLLDCTAPFIRKKDIKGAIKLLHTEKCDAVIGAYKQHMNPYFNMLEKKSDGFLKLVKTIKDRPASRQEAPIVYQFFGLYVYDVKKFMKKGKVIMSKMLPYEVPFETGLMIDTEIEFKIAEYLFNFMDENGNIKID
jgi:CMP-N-acetylneuraminic acid synthetase